MKTFLSVYKPHPILEYRHVAFGGIFFLSNVRAPVFGRHQFFGTSEHYGKAHGSVLFGWMNYEYTACCWFPTSSNILILPSLFWQIRFESYWLHCSKCRILVLFTVLHLQHPRRNARLCRVLASRQSHQLLILLLSMTKNLTLQETIA